jgi:hypothetical protein
VGEHMSLPLQRWAPLRTIVSHARAVGQSSLVGRASGGMRYWVRRGGGGGSAGTIPLHDGAVPSAVDADHHDEHDNGGGGGEDADSLTHSLTHSPTRSFPPRLPDYLLSSLTHPPTHLPSTYPSPIPLRSPSPCNTMSIPIPAAPNHTRAPSTPAALV